MSGTTLLALLLAGVAAAAAVHLAVRWARTPAEAQAAPWRLALLLAAQPALAALLFLALVPPPVHDGGGGGALLIATRRAPRLTVARPGERLVALPEAADVAGGERAPDLATALRRHPDADRLRIVGEGLGPRDREAAAGRRVSFDPPPPPRGLVELQGPAAPAPGDGFTVSGRVAGISGGAVELRDPAGRTVDRRPLPPSGTFDLAGAAREPGPALFTVAVRAPGGAEVEAVDLAVVTAAPAPRRVLLLAGAPGPEVKALRRWAVDAGMALTAAVSVGDGLELGDPRPPLTAAALSKVDLVVVDERSWAALDGGGRAALAAAARAGLGLLLRVTGPPPPATREAWRAFGLPLAAGEDAGPVRLPAVATTGDAPSLPELTRRGGDVPAPGSTPLLRDAAGGVLARWRPLGEGRVGVWTVSDSSGLTTAGYGDRYGELWSVLFGALSRAASAGELPTARDATAGRRVKVCGLSGDAEVVGPAGVEARLLPDPRSGSAACAGYWPREGGWRTVGVVAAAGRAAVDAPFYVRPAGQAAALLAEEDREATTALVGGGGATGAGHALRAPTAPGASWPWLLAWLVAAGATWWLERSRRGAERPDGGGGSRGHPPDRP